jgi:transcription initiation factor IIE alpha subunit
MSDGICPKCGETIERVRTRKDLFGTPPDVAGFIVTCPHCEAILGFLPNSQEIAETAAQKIREMHQMAQSPAPKFKDHES